MEAFGSRNSTTRAIKKNKGRPRLWNDRNADRETILKTPSEMTNEVTDKAQ